MQPKPIVSKTFTWRFWYLFSFYQGFLSRTLTTHRTVAEGRGDHLYSTLPFPPAHAHSDIYFSTLHVRRLSHISNRTACIYQADTRWDLTPYQITIWLIDDVMLIFVCLLVDFIQGSCYSYLTLETGELEHLMRLTLKELIHPEISYCKINFCVYWFFGNFAVYWQICENLSTSNLFYFSYPYK